MKREIPSGQVRPRATGPREGETSEQRAGRERKLQEQVCQEFKDARHSFSYQKPKR